MRDDHPKYAPNTQDRQESMLTERGLIQELYLKVKNLEEEIGRIYSLIGGDRR